MRIKKRGYTLRLHKTENRKYPVFSIVLAYILLLLGPFTTSWLAAASMLLCVYRVLRFDSRVFATDYCVLMPIYLLTKVGDSPALLYFLCLFAAIWIMFREGTPANSAFLTLIVLMNYFVCRMQLEISRYVLCLGQLAALCVLIPKQDSNSAERTAKAFCLSLLISSAYAILLRGTWQLQNVKGKETAAIWGTSIMRFEGVMSDPNYYMVSLIVALALLIKLKDSRRIRGAEFWIQCAIFAVFGVLTYSKTFFLCFILMCGVYVVWQFWNRKVFRGVLLTLLAVGVFAVLFSMEDSPFAVVIERLKSAKNISELTTSRTDLYDLYIMEITSDMKSLFFGKGLAAEGLYRDPHNYYIEVVYYSGLIGGLLTLMFYCALFRAVRRRTADQPKQNMVAKYEVLFFVLVLFFTLHGMFEAVLYTSFFLAYLAIFLTKKPEESVSE